MFIDKMVEKEETEERTPSTPPIFMVKQEFETNTLELIEKYENLEDFKKNICLPYFQHIYKVICMKKISMDSFLFQLFINQANAIFVTF